MLFFKDIFTNKQLTEKTQRLYNVYKNNVENFDNEFNEEFCINKKLVFLGLSNKEIMMKLLGEYYKNEYFIKTSFLNNILLKQKTAISGLELPVLNSRADIVSINGKSVAYEIKTNYDTLARLKGQLNDYMLCFEYVYVVCSKDLLNKVLKVIPNECGVYAYNNRCDTSFTKVKTASLSTKLSKEKMLDAMLLSELDQYFKTRNKDLICKDFTIEKISHCFKESLKARNKKRWTNYQKNYLTQDY